MVDTPSFWLSSLPKFEPRDPPVGSLDVDIAIIGGGFTGLWSAYYLKRAEPTLTVAVFESQYCGYGASGRNGGWASALFPASRQAIAQRYSEDAAHAMGSAMVASIDEIERAITELGIDCDFLRGGTLMVARSVPQLERLRAYHTEEMAAGNGDRVALLDAEQARSRINATGILGGIHTADCARIQPAKLVRGLASAAESLGVDIYEQAHVTDVRGDALVAAGQVVQARTILRCTEAFSSQMRGSRREVIPVYSLMIATDPIPDRIWSEIGWEGFETFADERHLVIYAQRTADGRIAFGGRGAPYHFGSSIDPAHDADEGFASVLRETLVELFPQLKEIEIAAHWGGPVAIPRDMFASVQFDRFTRHGSAGGYVGDGVTTTNLAGRTLAALVLDRSDDLLSLPWVNHHSPRWEPEPLRWLGVNAVLSLNAAADRKESRTGRSGWQLRLANLMAGA